MRGKLLKHRNASATTTGIGGAGKTQVTTRLVRDIRFGFVVVAWLRAETDVTLEDDLIQLGESDFEAFPSGTASDSLPRQHRIKMCLAKLEEIGARDPVLIIFDNAEEATGESGRTRRTPNTSTCLQRHATATRGPLTPRSLFRHSNPRSQLNFTAEL